MADDDDTQQDEGQEQDGPTSATKSPEDAAAQASVANPFVASDPDAPPVVLDHGEPSEVSEAEREAEEKVKNDPWGNTPMQMRDVHDEAVDPAKNDPTDDIRRSGGTRVDPMEPQVDEAIAEDHGIEGGTNAPA